MTGVTVLRTGICSHRSSAERVERISMPNKPSRREILGSAALGLTSMAVPITSVAQAAQEFNTDGVEKELARPLTPEAKKLLEAALKTIRTSSKDRLKTKLPENSEPCFTYIVSSSEERGK